jgi:hypothetical protein
VFTARYERNIYKPMLIEFRVQAVPWLRRLVAGLSLRRPGFHSSSANVRFMVDRVALGQVFLRVLRLSLVSVISCV